MNVGKNLKAWVAAVGSTLTAVSTCLATVSVAVGDDVVDAQELGAVATAVALCVSTIYGVWKVENKQVG